jgi:hypothetical protein
MKHILIFLTSLIAVTALAQPSTTKKEVYCDKTETMISILKGEDFQETPIWFGKEKDSKTPNYSLLVNQKTKSWTIIQFNKDMACVLGTGESFSLPNNKPYT